MYVCTYVCIYRNLFYTKRGYPKSKGKPKFLLTENNIINTHTNTYIYIYIYIHIYICIYIALYRIYIYIYIYIYMYIENGAFGSPSTTVANF